jgi:hypothetical protein
LEEKDVFLPGESRILYPRLLKYVLKLVDNIRHSDEGIKAGFTDNRTDKSRFASLEEFMAENPNERAMGGGKFDWGAKPTEHYEGDLQLFLEDDHYYREQEENGVDEFIAGGTPAPSRGALPGALPARASGGPGPAPGPLALRDRVSRGIEYGLGASDVESEEEGSDDSLQMPTYYTSNR